MYNTDWQLKLVSDRVGQLEYNKVSKAKKPFDISISESDCCGNVRVIFKDGKAMLFSEYPYPEGYIMAYEQISSALALYRTISMFETVVLSTSCDYYKMNWAVNLTHKKTGLAFTLGEWKGGFQIFTPAHNLKELPEQYIKDVEYLLTVLVSPKMPIGYDGTIAGSVA